MFVMDNYQVTESGVFYSNSLASSKIVWYIHSNLERLGA